MPRLSIGDLDASTRGPHEVRRRRFVQGALALARGRAAVGDPETLRLWRVIVDQSIAYLDLVYRDFGVTLTRTTLVGESFYNNMLSDVVTDLAAAGLIVEAAARCVSFLRASPTATARRYH